MPKIAAPTRKRLPRKAHRAPASDLNALRESLRQLQSLQLPTGDGDRMESDWHVVHISLIDELVRQHLGDPKHYFCGGNMFLFFSLEQAQEIIDYVDESAELVRRPRFKGPDFFLVKGVDGTKPRDSWEVWNEGGRYPDLIIEFVSSSTRKKDVERNVEFYEQVFHTPEYFWFDRRDSTLKGYRLQGGRYQEIPPNERGWLWSEELGAYLGVWQGDYRGRHYRWLRLYDQAGNLVPTREERIAELEAELKKLRGNV